MAKMGRPKVDDPKEHRVTIRFSNSEKQLLEDYAKKHNLTKVQVIKNGLELLFRQEENQ